ncbi:LysE/ArgO family amino acid transporter [Piscinibacterium candidicorallinum]|uniref:LysE/ArgO family amino acid transporter n=1 Tax=Piscinibacterium candidicorallinum TaxID=1793872 RepID=A0ABV7H508_9BURK
MTPDTFAGTALIGFGTSAALIIAIGAQNAFVLRQGLARAHVLPVVLICALSDALLISAGILGLGALVQQHTVLLEAARWGGAAFLLVYGAMAARRALRPGSMQAADGAAGSLKTALLACLAFTWLNPHVYLDTVVLLGSIASQQPGDQRAAFGVGAVSASIVWFTALGFGARWLAPLFARPAAWRVLDGLIACVMWAIALGLITN